MAKFFIVGKVMRSIILVITIVLTSTLISCTSYDFSHRIIQQGNLVPITKIQRLKIGMNKKDTATLMGTSLLSPTFNNSRWDYAYTFRQGSGIIKVHHLSLYFSDENLRKIDHQP
jgi:outer membrane protein assembly factor BamE